MKGLGDLTQRDGDQCRAGLVLGLEGLNPVLETGLADRPDRDRVPDGQGGGEARRVETPGAGGDHNRLADRLAVRVAPLADRVAGEVAGARVRAALVIGRPSEAPSAGLRPEAVPRGHVRAGLVQLARHGREARRHLLIHPLVEKRALLGVGDRRERDEPHGHQHQQPRQEPGAQRHA